MKLSICAFLAGALIIGSLAGCSTPTSNDSPAVTSTVYDLPITYSKAADTAIKHPGLTLQIKPAGSTGKTEISQAVVTFAVNAAAFAGGLDGSSWEFNTAAWAKAWNTGTNGSIAAGKWTTATLTSAHIATSYATASSSGTPGNTAGTSTTVTTVGGDVCLSLWSNWANWADISGGHLYVKSIVLTYADSTTETISPSAALVGTGASAGADAWRLGNWTPNAGTDGMTVGAAVISTVSF